tara:strand:- start:4367 stop:4561 length:195 start_codon:yes stop_codon:yes gene_type:complete
MKFVIRNKAQLANAYDKMLAELKAHDILVDFKEHSQPPRTLKQSRKIHAMITDLANETGDSMIK